VVILFPFGFSKGSGNVYGITLDSSVFVLEEDCEKVMLALNIANITTGRTSKLLLLSLKAIIVSLFKSFANLGLRANGFAPGQHQFEAIASNMLIHPMP
jgi:hypothetical protein